MGGPANTVRSKTGSIYADVALFCLSSNSYVSAQLDRLGAVALYENVITQLDSGKMLL